jgi:exosome complex exonuclease DIS3/RRP44
MDINKVIYGILEVNNRTAYGMRNEKRFYPFDKKLPVFYVPSKNPFSPVNIYCGIKFHRITNDKYYGLIEKYIGEIGNLDNELEYLKNICMVNWKGNSKFIIKDYLEDLTPERTDCTESYSYSIDPEGCVDVDDALNIKKTDENHYNIYIHIADVSSFIHPDSELDYELRKRKESLYLDKLQVNMIPDKLSLKYITLLERNVSGTLLERNVSGTLLERNVSGTLLERNVSGTLLERNVSGTLNETKRAFTLELNIEKQGDKYIIKKHKFYKSFIRVKNLSYEKAQKMINKNDYLKDLYEIGKYLYKEKFASSEYDIHKMVEIYMIIANVYSAKEIYDCEGAIFRKQDAKFDKITLDYNLEFNPNPAEYTTDKEHIKHEALEQELYTHFTSPMRRYVDIIVHRILSNKFCGTNFRIEYSDFIEELNNDHRKYKKMSNFAHLYKNIFSDDFKEVDTYSGFIIGFTNNKVRVYIKELGVTTIKLFDKKMGHLYDTKIDDKTYELNSLEYETKKYTIGDKVNVKIAITKYGDKKIQTLITSENS